MERIIYRKTLDLHKSGVQFTLQGFQTADNMSRTLELSLMASGDTIDLPLEQLMAVMYVTTPNATEPSITDCKIKDNTIVCDVPPIVEEGITEVKIKLIETGVEGARGVLALPKFAIEVSKSNMDEEGATQNATFSALETALAKAKGVYDSRVTRIVLSPDCIFSVYYADGTIYTSDALRDVVVNGESLIAKSYARGGTGVREGEDTDNSKYYSNVSQSSSIEANSAMEKSLELLEEVRKHGVYTAFSFNFEKGELEYVSPMYKFEIDKETGELIAIGEAYTFEEDVKHLTDEYMSNYTERYDANFKSLNESCKDLNDDVSNINSKMPEGVLGISFGGTGATTAEDARVNLGVAPAIKNDAYPGCFYRMVDGEVEWINPPISVGTERRTTERYMDGHGVWQPVYTQLFSFDCPSGEYTTSGQFIKNCIVIRFDGYTSNFMLPRTLAAAGLKQDIDVWRDSNYRYVQQSETKEDKVYVRLWYYKR
jgi:hypothetical protein